PLANDEIDRLLPFYDDGAKGPGGSGRSGGFEGGVRNVVEAILTSPHFIFRLEREPADGPADARRAKAGAPGAYRVTDVELASRLSFFLWGEPPDQELLTLAAQNKLSAPGMLEKQARRMLADKRADALSTRFGAQWLRLQDVDKVHPDPNFYPNFDENLAAAMRRETGMFFDSIRREERGLLGLLFARYP